MLANYHAARRKRLLVRIQTHKRSKVLVQEKYHFKAKVYHAKDLPDKKAYQAKHGSDLFITNIDEYDRICKVCPQLAVLTALHVVSSLQLMP